MALDLIPLLENSPIILAGQVASKQAALATFTDYRNRKAANTVRRQDVDLALFAQYLREAGPNVGNFATDPAAWRGITWGLVEGFVKWQLLKGYSVDSVNVRLSTVKTYAQLALKAGTMDMSEYAMIRTVKGYNHKEIKRINEKRLGNGLCVRIGSKKAQPISITEEQAAQLMTGDGTPKGRRDALLMCLMLDHGLRVGEIAMLQVSDFDLRSQRLVFYRQKVDKTQTHRLTERTLQAARSYMKIAPKDGSIWRHADRKGRNGLTTQGISERGINKRVELLG